MFSNFRQQIDSKSTPNDVLKELKSISEKQDNMIIELHSISKKQEEMNNEIKKIKRVLRTKGEAESDLGDFSYFETFPIQKEELCALEENALVSIA